MCIVLLNLFDWQKLQPNGGPGAIFFEFCDALGVKEGANAPPTGWGLEHAINAWGSFWKDIYYFYGKSLGEVSCLGSNGS